MRAALVSMLGAVALIGSVAAPAQIQPVDPDRAIDGDLTAPAASPTPAPSAAPTIVAEPVSVDAVPQEGPASDPAAATPADPATYQKDDLVGEAEKVFGKGAAGLGGLIEDLLRKQGQPNAYITGREGGGAVIIGLRYGSGTLHHKIEGERKVYWTGPSVGLDAGANAGSTFVLVYNLYNSEDIFRRYGAGEGQAYLVGGFNVSYLRRGDVVLIPIRMGVGLRLGVNAGYMKFSRKQNWFPF
ncbi:MAG: DUF1134 domain-containing protein [Sphingomonadaceae bacterium]|nr:DUF1134 domain-containing protein [Sphingomonadaceae bacterium]